MTLISFPKTKKFTMDYFQIKKISNSDLGIAKNILAGKPQPKRPEKAFSFGSAFHEALLEPDRYRSLEWAEKGVDVTKVEKLLQSALANEAVRKILKNGKNEQVIEWTHQQTGVECKSKLDIIQSKKELIVTDIKTTSATTQADFETDFIFYEYNRQAAFYMQSIGAKEFFSVGISKANGQIFIVRKFWDNHEIISGRQKITRILQDIKDNNLFEKIFELRGK
jgi:hypothetical protein